MQIDEERISKVVKSLKNRRASGTGETPSELLKNGTPNLIQLFMRYVNGEEIPTTWKEVGITQIHKKTRRDDCKIIDVF